MLNVILNLCLFAVKFIGGKLSNSVSIISDAFNNLSDAVTTFFAFIGVKVSSIGAGENHPNGHGRFEWVIALLSSSAVILIGWELLTDSFNAIKNPEKQVFNIFTVIVLIVSISVKVFMYFYNLKKSKVNKLASLKAVAVDCISDAASTFVVLISLLVSSAFSINIDGYCGIAVSLFIMYNGLISGVETCERIMGQSDSKENIKELSDFVLKNNDIKAVENLQIEDYGYGRFRTSMTILGKDNVSPEKLLEDSLELKYLIYNKYGYNTLISIESNIIHDEIIEKFIDNTLNSLKVKLKILTLRVNKANNIKLVLLDLGINFNIYASSKELLKDLNEKFDNAPEGYKIIPTIKLTRDYERHQRHKAKKENTSVL